MNELLRHASSFDAGNGSVRKRSNPRLPTKDRCGAHHARDEATGTEARGKAEGGAQGEGQD